ncbi:MAG: S8 family peptidase [Candidatus Hodarchaeales archaeon]
MNLFNHKTKRKKVFSLIIFILVIISISSYAIHRLNVPNYQWHLEKISAKEAWTITQGNSEIIIAVIDSGIDITHPALVNKSWVNFDEIPDNNIDDDDNGYIDDVRGWDFQSNDSDTFPDNEHGTFVAGMITAGGSTYENIGIVPNVSLMDLKVLNPEGSILLHQIDEFVKAIDYAINNGAQVIQMSISLRGHPPPIFYNAIKQAYDNGIIIVGITGNFGAEVTFPGAYPEVIAVSAVDSNNKITTFSGKGEQNEICAPGMDLFGISLVNDLLVKRSGTSYASPLVAGTVALMLSVNSDLSVNEIRDILHTTAIDLGKDGKDDDYGYGLINASGAVHSALVTLNL